MTQPLFLKNSFKLAEEKNFHTYSNAWERALIFSHNIVFGKFKALLVDKEKSFKNIS